MTFGLWRNLGYRKQSIALEYDVASSKHVLRIVIKNTSALDWQKGRRKRSRTELRLAKYFCLIKRPVHDLLLFFFVLIQKRTKKDQARTLPLYALLAALQPHMPEWAALFVHVCPAIPKWNSQLLYGMKLECVGGAKKRACDGRWARSIFLPCLFWSFFRLSVSSRYGGGKKDEERERAMNYTRPKSFGWWLLATCTQVNRHFCLFSKVYQATGKNPVSFYKNNHYVYLRIRKVVKPNLSSALPNANSTPPNSSWWV